MLKTNTQDTFYIPSSYSETPDTTVLESNEIKKLKDILERNSYMEIDELVELPLGLDTIEIVKKGWDAWLEKNPKLSALHEIGLDDYILGKHKRSVKKALKQVTRLEPDAYGRQVIDHVVMYLSRIDLSMVPPLNNVVNILSGQNPKASQVKALNWQLKGSRMMHIVEGLERSSHHDNSIHRLATRWFLTQYHRPGLSYACEVTKREIRNMHKTVSSWNSYPTNQRKDKHKSCFPLDKLSSKLSKGAMKKRLDYAYKTTLPQIQRLQNSQDAKLI